MFARRLMPGLGKVLIAAAAVASVRDQNALARYGKIGDGLVRMLIVCDRANRHQQRHIVAGLAGTIRTFAVAAAVSFEFAVVAVTQQRVVVGIGFEVDAAATTAVPSGRSTTRNIFFAAERDAAIAAVASLYINFGFINEHREPALRWPPQVAATAPKDTTPNAIRKRFGGFQVAILRPPWRARHDNAFVFNAEKTRPAKAGAGTSLSAITRVVQQGLHVPALRNC